MVTADNAAIMGLQGYGLEPGCVASLVVLDGGNPTEALRLRPDRLAVVSKGKVVAERQRNDARLTLPKRPASMTRRFLS
jgi:cytosine deaminase